MFAEISPVAHHGFDGVLLLGFVAASGVFGMAADTRQTGRTGRSADLLTRIGNGDASAFRALYDDRSPQLYAIALRITRSPALAADAVHDALLQVWRNAARYDATRGDADGWLTSLVRYRALDIARRHAREVTGLNMPDPLDEEPNALSRLVSNAEGVALRDCLEQVDPPRRKLVLLAFFDGLTQTEIATRVGQPLGTVKSTIRRTLISLKACLDFHTSSPPELPQ